MFMISISSCQEFGLFSSTQNLSCLKQVGRDVMACVIDFDDLGSGRTGLTKFVSPFQNSRQNLSLPNFQFVKRGRTDTQQNIC